MLDKNQYLTDTFNHGMAYWIYGVMGILAALFIWKFVPETKGKTLEELYSKSGRQGTLITALCLMAVFLSLVGVFGLVIFELQGREKEIAVRKVHGSTVRQILWMLNSSFLRITLVCFIISIPLAYYGVNVWLRSFAYKTPIYVWVFLVALVIIMTLTVSTVTFQSYRAAMANPASKLGH